MLNSAILEVIIGMVFVYILMSLLVAQINSVVASLWNIRAEQLRKRVEDIIFDEDMQKAIMGHPIVSMTTPPRKTNKSAEQVSAAEMETARVSKVKPKTLAKATVNVLSDPFLEIYALVAKVENDKEQAQLQAATNQVKANINDPQRSNAALNQLHEVISQLQPEDRRDRRALLRSLGPLQGALRDYADENKQLLLIYEGIAQVDNVVFQRALETVLAGVGTVKEAEAAIADWFDNKLEQTSNWYATTMQYFSLAFGLVVAVLINIDSLHIATTLWRNDELRASVVQAVDVVELSTYFDEDGNLILDPRVDLPEDAGGLTPENMTSQNLASENLTSETVGDVARNYEATQDTLNQLLALNLPIGWTFHTSSETVQVGNADVTVYDHTTDNRNLYRFLIITDEGWFGFVVGKLAGLIITGIATAQGAPFWFDILRRLSGQSSPAKVDDKADEG